MEGTKRKQLDRKLYVGWAESKVIAVNPTLEELEKVGIEMEEEPEYTKKTKDGEEVKLIDFWMEELKTGYKYKRTIFIQDEIVKSKPKEGQEDSFVEKTQYINQVGDTAWAASKKDLRDGFTKFRKKDKKNDGEYEVYGDKAFRIAKRGEGNLMEFIKKWLSGYDYYSTDTNILLDMKRLFNGNFKEIKEQVNGEFATIDRGNGKEYPTTVADLLEIKTQTTEEGPKEWQSVWKNTAAGWHMKLIRNTEFTEKNIDKWAKSAADMNKWNADGRKGKAPDGARYLKDYEKIAVEATLGEYKSKNYLVFEMMREYNPDENFVASGQTVVQGGEEITADGPDY